MPSTHRGTRLVDRVRTFARPSAPESFEDLTGWKRLLHGMRDASRRNIYFSVLAIPGHLAMAASKALVLLATFSAFMAANVLFTVGLAVIKVLVVRAHRAGRPSRGHGVDTDGSIARAYRATGVLVLVLSVAYVVSCLPLALGANTSQEYEQFVAIGIATVAFTELGFSLHGFFASRKRRDPLMEAIKLSNLASALILLVLAQTALLSFAADGDTSRYNGWCGVGMGTIAAGIGVYMLVQPRSRMLRSVA